MLENKMKPCVLNVVSVVPVIFCIAIGLGITGLASAQSQPREVQEEPVISVRADSLLKEMGEYLADSKEFTFHAEVTFDELMHSGQKIQYSSSKDVAVRRPDRIYAESHGDLGSKRFWYDGENITLLNEDLGVYATSPAKPTIDKTVDHIMEKFGFALPLADLVYKDPYAILIENVQFGIYAGLHNVGGVRCHHLAFVEKFIDWQIWIEDGKQLVPRKIVITYKTMPGSPQFTAVLSEWDLKTRLPESIFTADIPADQGITKIEFLTVKEADTEN
jgi:hypothetical protein